MLVAHGNMPTLCCNNSGTRSPLLAAVLLFAHLAFVFAAVARLLETVSCILSYPGQRVSNELYSIYVRASIAIRENSCCSRKELENESPASTTCCNLYLVRIFYRGRLIRGIFLVGRYTVRSWQWTKKRPSTS